MYDAIDAHQPQQVIHLGDLKEDAEEVSYAYPQLPFCMVPGNCDGWTSDPAIRYITLESKNILLSHGHLWGVKQGYGTAIAQARTDRAAMDRLRTSGKRLPLLPLLAALLLLPAGILLLTLSLRIPGAICLAIGLPLLCLALILRQKVTRYNRLLENDRQQLLAKYQQLPPDCWVPAAREYADQLRNYLTARDLYAKDREDLTKRLQQLCDSFRYPYRNDTVEYPVSTSIGAAMYPTDGKGYLQLLNHADAALYVAKRQGKNQFVMYHPSYEEISM
jgi:hypothetical protein